MKKRLPPTGEGGSLLLGLAAVAAGGLFASVMLTRDGRAPRIAAIEHFGIFARPAALRAARPPFDPGVDPVVTGGVARPGHGASPTAARAATLGGYRIVGVLGDQAIVVGDAGFHRVRAGDSLPGAGEIARIDRREDGWSLVLRDGSVIARSREPAGAR